MQATHYQLNNLIIHSKSSSASVATAVSAGQKYIFDERNTWFPHTKQPTVSMWGEGSSEDPKIEEFKVTGTNVSAVHQLYSNINRGVYHVQNNSKKEDCNLRISYDD